MEALHKVLFHLSAGRSEMKTCLWSSCTWCDRKPSQFILIGLALRKLRVDFPCDWEIQNAWCLQAEPRNGSESIIRADMSIRFSHYVFLRANADIFVWCCSCNFNHFYNNKVSVDSMKSQFTDSLTSCVINNVYSMNTHCISLYKSSCARRGDLSSE